METITLGSNKYFLVPESDWNEVEELLRFYLSGQKPKSPTPSVEPSISLDGSDVRMAQPKISDYRERFKRHELTKNDVVAPPAPVKLHQFESEEFSKYTYDGENLFFGKGLEYDYL